MMLYATPPQANFLHATADLWRVLAGEEPLAQAKGIIFLPNRRSCRALQRMMLLASGAGVLMPKIVPLGDIDPLWLMAELRRAGDTRLINRLEAMPLVVSGFKRQLALAGLLKEEAIHQPSLLKPDAIAGLAEELADLLDELTREQIPAEKLAMLQPDLLAQHWQEGAGLLKTAWQWWQGYKQAQHVVSETEQRLIMLNLLTECWQIAPPPYPVLIGGSTASQPATFQLVKAVLDMPRGAALLPGLDDAAREEEWPLTHPQYALQQLLLKLGMPKVTFFPATVPPRRNLDEVPLINCADEWEEVRLITLLCEEWLHQQKTIGVICPDHKLASRLEQLLLAKGIHPGNHIAQPLAAEPLVNWILLLLDVAATPTQPVPLLSLLKSPLCRLNHHESLTGLELAMRGIRRERDWLAQFTRLAGEPGGEFYQEIAGALQPLTRLFERQVAGERFVQEHQRAIAALVNPDHWPEGSAAVSALQSWWQEISASGYAAADYWADALRRAALRTPQLAHADPLAPVQIISPMDARLLRFDRCVLAGLNENSWPRRTSPGLLNKPLRRMLGLTEAQSVIGQQAHDFAMLHSAGEVFLTRARRQEGADSLPARWLELAVMQADATPYRGWLHHSEKTERRSETMPPVPIPAMALRPRELSVSECDLWLRDPYSIYARHILKLRPLDPIDEAVSAATMGSVLHRIIEHFIVAVNEDSARLTRETFLRCRDQVLARYAANPHVALIWSPRIENLADWLIDMERLRREDACIMPEVSLRLQLDGLTIKGRIDRLESRASGVSVVDYKTGMAPSGADLARGYAAQLPLLALLAENEEGSKAEMLEYWQLSSGQRIPEIKQFAAEEWSELYREGLRQMITRYSNEAQPYCPIPAPAYKPAFNDYAELSRQDEWL